MSEPRTSRTALIGGVVARFLAGLILIAVLLFLPAGTLRWWQGWLYLGVLFIPMTAMGLVLLLRAPDLLKRRMRMRETHAQQKVAIAALALLILAIIAIPGFDRRYGWSAVPVYVVLAADALVLLGFAFYALTMRENRYASRVIELQQDQVVITTGPYALVRHPMYLGMGLMFAVSPLALGSYWGLIPGLLFPLLLALRISDEERMLRRSLKGYDEYARKVKYRLIPFVW